MAMAIHAGTEGATSWGGVRVVTYTVRGRNTVGLHPWLVDFETKALRAEACWRAAREIKAQGFSPDLIMAHPGWGEALFLKQVWPQSKLVLYAEYFYRAVGADLGFDPEFGSEDPDAQACRVQLKNLNNLAHLDQAHAAISPTQWQADTFPDTWRQRIRVMHDGIDTDALCPLPDAQVTLGTLELSRSDEVITYVARHLDPYRGIHIFMRALPALLQLRPHARVVIVGGDGSGYGAAAPDGKSWRQIFVEEVKDAIPAQDWARVHFVGRLGRQAFTSLLQVSRVHVYLSYPFVLSWSLLEAMSVGCSIVASNTAPVREAITHGEHGELVDFFDGPGLVNQISCLLDDAKQRERLGSMARQRAVERYDLKRVCLPQHLTWINSLSRR